MQTTQVGQELFIRLENMWFSIICGSQSFVSFWPSSFCP